MLVVLACQADRAKSSHIVVTMFGRHERGRFGGNFVAAFYGDVVNQNGPETVLGEETVIAEKTIIGPESSRLPTRRPEAARQLKAIEGKLVRSLGSWGTEATISRVSMSSNEPFVPNHVEALLHPAHHHYTPHRAPERVSPRGGPWRGDELMCVCRWKECRTWLHGPLVFS